MISAALGSLLLCTACSGKGKFLKGTLGGYLLFRGITGYCPLREALLPDETSKSIEIGTSLTVNKPLEETYRYWRKLSNLPIFMKHIESIEELDDQRSVWEAILPWEILKVRWEAEITEEKENELIAWRSVENSTIYNSGIVHFRNAGKFGTEINVEISYALPGGEAGALAAKLVNPMFEDIVREDSKNFRSYLETGEIPTTEGQPSNH